MLQGHIYLLKHKLKYVWESVFPILLLNTKSQSSFLGYETNTLVHDLPLFAFEGGISKQFDISNRLVINPEILISKNGVNYNTKFLYDDIKYQLHIWYLKTPVLLQLNTNVKKQKQSGIYAGPYFAIKLSSKLINEVWGNQEKESFSNVNNFDFGAVAGFTWDLGQSFEKFMLDFRCSYGLINCMKPIEGNIPPYDGPDKEYARNVNFLIAVFYKI